ncbi:MAG: DNA polymerase Y family protein [Deltaproteobacteria bacterium]|nr:DNA polymerase Y family protein [Deltaproteobacteria bacterium]
MIACVDVPALPLQLVWRDRPEWRALPVVILDEDHPQGTVLWACERARAQRILPGMRYAHALSLVGGLRAEVMAAPRITALVDELAAALRMCSPSVEVARITDRDATEGTFWLDGAGLARTFVDAPHEPAGTRWGQAIAAAVARLGVAAATIVGCTRFGTYALARAARGRGVMVVSNDVDERAAARQVPLARLDVAPKLRDALARLAVTTVGELVRLPAGGVLERFGSDAHRLYELAAGERWDPLVPEPPPDAPDERVLLDDPERDVDRLLFSIKAAVDRLLARLAARHRALTVLHLELTVQHGVHANAVQAVRAAHAIRPAAATLDGRGLLRLVRLRLEGAPLDELTPASGSNRNARSVGVIGVRVWADDQAATREQLNLFAQRPRRDLRAADEAVARLRAELGDDAVVKAVVRDAHLPEARFGWERFGQMVPAAPRPLRTVAGHSWRPLVRRVLMRPKLLPASSPHVRDDGWLINGLEHGAVVRIHGPFVVSGGWWAPGAGEVCREYHFAETRRGECLWVYFDRPRRRWFQHGAVE